MIKLLIIFQQFAGITFYHLALNPSVLCRLRAIAARSPNS